MRLQLLTKDEVAAVLNERPLMVLATGSTEQHGPLGLCGTDALCAEDIAARAAEQTQTLLLPTLAYGPAQFHMGFPGTISIKARTMMRLFEDLIDSLAAQAVKGLYVINGHDANNASLDAAIHDSYARLGTDAPVVRVRNWWAFEPIERIRRQTFGIWEGLHARPSDIAVTQYGHRRVDDADFKRPTQPLTSQFLRNHSGDRLPPAARHRAEFSDGVVGADSALATPDLGREILEMAVTCAVAEIGQFKAEIT